MNEEKKTLLDVRHLSVGFESYNARLERVTFQAISDLSVSVSEGEILAIVGSSGSGKSLLAHAVMDILPGNAKIGGEMFYRGEALTQARQSARDDAAPKTAVKCPLCGATTVPDASGRCEYCGGPVNG